MKYETANVIARVCQRLLRRVGYLWPWESVPAAKMLGFANFNEVAAATLGEKGPNTFLSV